MLVASPRFLGLVLLALGVLVNKWSLGWLFAPDGAVTGQSKVALIVFFQAVLLLSGISLALERTRAWLEGRAGLFRGASIFLLVALCASFLDWGIRAYRSSHMHTVHAGHGAPPTLEERRWADDFYLRSLEAAKRNGWFDFEKARVDGFVKLWKDRAHYWNEAFVFDDELLNPDRPEFLMYLDVPEGKTLIGFMYLARSREEKGPELGGPLARWHYHPWPNGLCALGGILPVGRPDEDGRCAEGERVARSAEMLHVYFVDHPLGRFADGMVFPDKKSLLDVTLLHPVFVHFTIALFIIAVALDVAGKITGRAQLHSAAWVNLLLSGIFAVLTVVAGLAAEVNLLISPGVHATLTTHKKLGFSVFGVVAVLVAWRLWLRGAFPTRAWLLYLALGAGGAGLTLAAGYYGAELVYVEGVGVQAVDRLALENHRERVRLEYLPREPVDLPLANHHHD